MMFAYPPVEERELKSKEDTMKGKLYSAAIGKIVLFSTILILLASTVFGPGAMTALANPPDHDPEHTDYMSIAAPAFTEYVYQQVSVAAGATGAAVAA
jgi:hypothetical protein